MFDCIVLAETAANRRLIMLIVSFSIDTDTEIDWIAYMQEVEGYEQVRFSGPTLPLV